MRFRTLVALALLPVFVACNHPPDTVLKKTFNNDGTVSYGVSGTDPDPGDYAATISLLVNNSKTYSLLDKGSQTVPIVDGTNTAQATAYDTHGVADPTPATTSFDIPTDERAYQLIDSALVQKSQIFYKNAVVSPGAFNEFYVDYLIKMKPDETKDAVMIYASKNLNNALSKVAILNQYGIPTLCMTMAPEGTLTDWVNGFIDNGYK